MSNEGAVLPIPHLHGCSLSFEEMPAFDLFSFDVSLYFHIALPLLSTWGMI